MCNTVHKTNSTNTPFANAHKVICKHKLACVADMGHLSDCKQNQHELQEKSAVKTMVNHVNGKLAVISLLGQFTLNQTSMGGYAINLCNNSG